LTEYLDLADYLLIVEAVLGVPAEAIARWPGIGLAESALHAPAATFEGVEFYPDVLDKAAVLCVRLARNHPLPDGNKRVAYLAMVELLVRNGVDWLPPSVDETVATVEGAAAGEISEPAGSKPEPFVSRQRTRPSHSVRRLGLEGRRSEPARVREEKRGRRPPRLRVVAKHRLALSQHDPGRAR